MTTEMTEATRSLLLKLRKGATAGFEVKQWQAVLVELGFEVVVTKQRNTAIQFTVKYHGVEVAKINKEPNYRRIVFYDLLRQMAKAKIDPRVMACVALGMETPDEEKRLNDLYVRDLTNTGTCPVCLGNFKRDTAAKMVHHGYTRPGDGYQHGDCYAVGYRCWEESAEGAIAYLQNALRPYKAGQEETLRALKAGEVKKFFIQKHRWVGYRQEKYTEELTREINEYEFERELESSIHQTERRIKMVTQDIAEFETRIAAWKPDVLPEVKYAGKFKVA